MTNEQRILVVDDDKEIRDVLTRVFSGDGFQVRAAADGKQGLAEIREWEPHMVLLDLEMPRLSGFDVMRHIQAHHDGVGVIAFSGHSAAEQLGEDARRLGAIEFFVKPFDIDAIAAAVDGALQRHAV